MPIAFWRTADAQITAALAPFGLEEAEFHAAWLLRSYFEQSKIKDFHVLSWQDRRREVTKIRISELLRLQKTGNGKSHSRAKKLYKHTEPYIHLTLQERQQAAADVANCIQRWTDCQVFSECIDKVQFDPVKTGRTVGEQAFEQVVSRFHHYMVRINSVPENEKYGILVHDNNATVAKKTH